MFLYTYTYQKCYDLSKKVDICNVLKIFFFLSLVIKMNKKQLLWTKQKNAKRICTKSLLFNDSKIKSKECHGNKKRKTARTSTKQLQILFWRRRDKKQREYGRMEDIDIRIRLKETKKSKTIWTNLLGLRKMFLYIGKKIPYIVQKRNEKKLIFGGIENNKRESHNPKNLVFINDVLDFHKSNTDKTLIYNNVTFGRKGYKYLIVWKDYD